MYKSTIASRYETRSSAPFTLSPDTSPVLDASLIIPLSKSLPISTALPQAYSSTFSASLSVMLSFGLKYLFESPTIKPSLAIILIDSQYLFVDSTSLNGVAFSGSGASVISSELPSPFHIQPSTSSKTGSFVKPRNFFVSVSVSPFIEFQFKTFTTISANSALVTLSFGCLSLFLTSPSPSRVSAALT